MGRLLFIGLSVVLAGCGTDQARVTTDPALERQREEAFQKAVSEYDLHTQEDDWQFRVGIDRRLLRDAGKLSPERLANRLHAKPDDLGVATAVAVCLGGGSRDDSPKLVAELLVELLGSRFERVRYRAAESVTQRVQDGTMPEGAADSIKPQIDKAIKDETNVLVLESLKYAGRLLEAR
jgi:hypothetical protein